MNALELFKTIIPTGYPYIQYIGDNGTIARRGYWSRGIHVWDVLETTGKTFFHTGPVPTEDLKVGATGLVVGKGYLEYDELKAGLVTWDKLMRHYQIAACGTYTEILRDVDWESQVFCAKSGKDTMLIDGSLHFINGKSIPIKSEVVCYHLNKEFAEIVKSSRLINLKWFDDEFKALLGFDAGNIGGIILSWDMKSGKELLEAKHHGRTIRFHRDEKTIRMEDEEMKCNIPEIPGVKKPSEAPTTEEKKPVEKPKKTVGETPDLPGVPPKVEPEKPEVVERTPAEIAEALSEAMKNLRELMAAATKILKRGGASSDEMKAMKAQVKELRAQLKEESDKRADAEKRDAASRTALKALVGGKDF